MWISCLILVLTAGVYTLWPLFVKIVDENAPLRTETEGDYLTGRKAAIYRNIRELEFEYRMGRLTETDFRQLETEYKREAADILQKLDELSAPVSPVTMPEPNDKTYACPVCGAKIIPDKKFCADCGARLQV